MKIPLKRLFKPGPLFQKFIHLGKEIPEGDMHVIKQAVAWTTQGRQVDSRFVPKGIISFSESINDRSTGASSEFVETLKEILPGTKNNLVPIKEWVFNFDNVGFQLNRNLRWSVFS